MERERWYQIKKGMEKNGWRCVVEFHPNLPEDIKGSLTADKMTQYPKHQYDHQWYYNHNAYQCLFVRRKSSGLNPEANTYREPIIKRIDAQTLKGIEKYGTVLPRNTAPLLERLEHQQQELTDGLVYGEWIIDGLTRLAEHVAKLKKHVDDSFDEVKGMTHSIRRNHVTTMRMVNRILEELSGLGKSKQGCAPDSE
jgi:uncharacterized protein YoxC